MKIFSLNKKHLNQYILLPQTDKTLVKRFMIIKRLKWNLTKRNLIGKSPNYKIARTIIIIRNCDVSFQGIPNTVCYDAARRVRKGSFLYRSMDLRHQSPKVEPVATRLLSRYIMLTRTFKRSDSSLCFFSDTGKNCKRGASGWAFANRYQHRTTATRSPRRQKSWKTTRKWHARRLLTSSTGNLDIFEDKTSGFSGRLIEAHWSHHECRLDLRPSIFTFDLGATRPRKVELWEADIQFTPIPSIVLLLKHY